MTSDELIAALAKPMPYGQHVFGLDIPGLDVQAFRVVDHDDDCEIIRLVAVGDRHIREHHVSDLYEIERDVCSCGQLGCEWHLNDD